MLKQPVTQVFASGFISPEGPSFDQQGILHIVDWDAKSIYRISEIGQASCFVVTGGVPTGSKFHRNGHLYVADGDLGILDISPDGAIRVAAAGWANQPFRGPNDLIFAANGDLYFTDPRGSGRDKPTGNVFILRADGTVELLAGGFQFPNGIALSADERTLYLAETSLNRILAFELDEMGRERSRRVFVQLEGGAGPDGMAFGQDGNLYIAHFGKGVIAVVNPQGEVIAELPTVGINPTNVAFGQTSLYVTEVEKGQVEQINIDVEGLPLYGSS